MAPNSKALRWIVKEVVVGKGSCWFLPSQRFLLVWHSLLNGEGVEILIFWGSLQGEPNTET